MRGLALCCVVALTIVQARASDLSSARAREAMRLCTAVDAEAEGQTAAMEKLDRAVVVAQSAIAADDSDAHAHLALFCGLGRQLEIAGLSWRSFGRLAAANEAIDRAAALAPEDPDVLVARGAFISGIPRPLGGNRALGEKLLAHALEIAPDHVGARLHLAKSMAARHAPEARLRAYEAIAAAKKAGAAREQAEAAKLLASIAK
jgi:hypothetical protein